jgi:hypothetical protein
LQIRERSDKKVRIDLYNFGLDIHVETLRLW